MAEVVPRFFVQRKYESFTRQLNGWGFKRLHQSGNDYNCYYHECFLRGLPHLTALLTRSKPGQGKLIPHVEGEPNFYEIDRMFPLPPPSPTGPPHMPWDAAGGYGAPPPRGPPRGPPAEPYPHAPYGPPPHRGYPPPPPYYAAPPGRHPAADGGVHHGYPPPPFYPPQYGPPGYYPPYPDHHLAGPHGAAAPYFYGPPPSHADAPAQGAASGDAVGEHVPMQEVASGPLQICVSNQVSGGPT